MSNGNSFVDRPIDAGTGQVQPLRGGTTFQDRTIVPLNQYHRRQVTEGMDTLEREALRQAEGLSFFDKLLVGAGQRSVKILTSLPVVGEGFAQLLGVQDEVLEIPGLGAGGIIGSIVPDLLLFRGLAPVGRAGTALAASKGAGPVLSRIAGEAALGAGYGGLTHRNRLEGAALDAALFGGLGALGEAAMKLPGEVSTRLMWARKGEKYVDTARDAIAERTGLTTVEGIQAARSHGITAYEDAVRQMEYPLSGEIAGAASRDFSAAVRSAKAPKKLRENLHRFYGKLKKIGWEPKDIDAYFEAIAGTKDIGEMTLAGADVLQLELRSMHRISQTLQRAGKGLEEAADPIFVSQVRANMVNDGISVSFLERWFTPFIDVLNTLEHETKLPFRTMAEPVIRGVQRVQGVREEVVKRLAIATGRVKPRTWEEMSQKDIGLLAKRMGKEVKAIHKDRRTVMMGFLQGPDLFNRVMQAGKDDLAAEGIRLTGDELTQAALKRGAKILGPTDRQLWNIVKDNMGSRQQMEKLLTPEELRYARAIQDIMEDMRHMINAAEIDATKKMARDAPHLVRDGKIFLPPKVGYMPKFNDLMDSMYGSQVSQDLRVKEASFLKPRREEAIEFSTDPFEVLERYVRRATKLVELERPMRNAIKFANSVKVVENTLGVSEPVSGSYASEAMEYWLGRAWGMPTKSDEKVAGWINELSKLMGFKNMAPESSLEVAAMVRDLYYIGLIGLRLPFVAARNITQAPLLAGTELGGGFSWVGRGYARAIKEMRVGGALKPIREAGALPSYGEAMDMAVEGGVGRLHNVADHIARVRDVSMKLFSRSDRLNRLAAFWGAVEKFEHYSRKVASAELKPGQTQLDWFMDKVGMTQLKPGEQDLFRRALAPAHKNGSFLAQGEKGVVEARKALEEAKHKFGASVANRTQFAYSTVGSPLVTRSVAGKLGFQFLTWPMYYGNFLSTIVMGKHNPHKGTAALHMAMMTLVMSEWLKFIEYDPATSMLLGPFSNAFTRTEYGDYTISPGPGVSSAVNLMGSFLSDVNNALSGNLDGSETLRTVGGIGEGLFLGARDLDRLDRVLSGRQKTYK